MHRIAVALALFLFVACTDDEQLDSSRFAVDANDNGTFDCADLDHVLACIEHHGSTVCAHADVNHDGVVDDADAHDIYSALHDSGHQCSDPTH
jgi:hypothetical protein